MPFVGIRGNTPLGPPPPYTQRKDFDMSHIINRVDVGHFVSELGVTCPP